jgi:hypothetical protein
MREAAHRLSMEIGGQWDRWMIDSLIDLVREYGIDRLRWIRTVGNVGGFGPAVFVRLAGERIDEVWRVTVS